MRIAVLLAFCYVLVACGGSVPPPPAAVPTPIVTTPVTKAAPPLVVFLGDSVTAYWSDYADFPAHQWFDAGVSGQTCAQMLARFQTDVLDKHPAAMHLLCGTNDIWQGATDEATTEANIAAMIRQAQAANIRVVLATVPYIRTGGVPSPERDGRVNTLNSWLRATALPIADYNHALTDFDGLMDMRYTNDGVHPNAQGYALMTPLAEAALAP